LSFCQILFDDTQIVLYYLLASRTLMNRLSTSRQVTSSFALVEGVSINATCRMAGVAKHTVLKLLKDPGCAAASYHNSRIRELRVRRVQADEIWAFVYGIVTPAMEAGLTDHVWAIEELIATVQHQNSVRAKSLPLTVNETVSGLVVTVAHDS